MAAVPWRAMLARLVISQTGLHLVPPRAVEQVYRLASNVPEGTRSPVGRPTWVSHNGDTPRSCLRRRVREDVWLVSEFLCDCEALDSGHTLQVLRTSASALSTNVRLGRASTSWWCGSVLIGGCQNDCECGVCRVMRASSCSGLCAGAAENRSRRL